MYFYFREADGDGVLLGPLSEHAKSEESMIENNITSLYINNVANTQTAPFHGSRKESVSSPGGGDARGSQFSTKLHPRSLRSSKCKESLCKCI